MEANLADYPDIRRTERGRPRRLGPSPGDGSDSINHLPRLSHSEQAELRAKHQAIRLAGEQLAELGQLMLAAERELLANPTAENFAAARAAEQRYHAAKDDDRCVEAYLATERKVIASARAREAREAREVCRALARVTHRAPFRQRQRQRSSHRRAAARPATKATADPDGEPSSSRHHLTSEVVPC